MKTLEIENFVSYQEHCMPIQTHFNIKKQGWKELTKDWSERTIKIDTDTEFEATACTSDREENNIHIRLTTHELNK